MDFWKMTKNPKKALRFSIFLYMIIAVPLKGKTKSRRNEECQ